MNSKNGITLMAIVVTTIVLLILVGVTISLISIEDSVTNRAANSKVESRYASVIDKVKIRETELVIEKHSGNSALTQQQFVENLISEGILDLNYDSYEPDFSAVYIGKLEDGTYKYTIPITQENVITETSSEIITFIFNLNGGKIGGSTENQIRSGVHGTNILKPEDPTRKDYRFDGWSPDVPLTLDENRIFTAKWIFSPVPF